MFLNYAEETFFIVIGVIEDRFDLNNCANKRWSYAVGLTNSRAIIGMLVFYFAFILPSLYFDYYSCSF